MTFGSTIDEEILTESLPGYQYSASRPIDPILRWNDIEYKVKTAKKDKWKTILSGISGQAYPGEMVALIGSSGAGKTTLLDTLAGRVSSGKLAGDIDFLGSKRNPRTFKHSMAYVQQHDAMHPQLTVAETLAFTARLRLYNGSYSEEEKARRVEDVIHRLRLTEARDTAVGDPLTRGISGGEKKRVSIGNELLIDPRLLLLDEPTSGLDSNSAEMTIELLKSITQEKRLCTIVTIHQPSARIFNMFDRVMLMSLGKTVYFGPTRNAAQYFADLGFTCPIHENPADFFIDLATLDHRNQKTLLASMERIEMLAATHKQRCSSHESENMSRTRDADTPTEDHAEAHHNNNWLYEFGLLMQRNWICVLRNTIFVWGLVSTSIVFAFIIGFSYYYFTDDQIGALNRLGGMFVISVSSVYAVTLPLLPLYISENVVLLRERASGTHRISTFFLAKAATYTPIFIAVCGIFFSGFYFISRLALDPAKYFVSLGVNSLVIVSSVGLAMLIGSMTRSIELAGTVAFAVMAIQLIFGGMVANTRVITPALGWIRWINPVFYSFSVMAQNEFKGHNFECNGSQGCFSIGNEVLMGYGLRDLDIGPSILLLVGLIIVNYSSGYIMLRWVSKPKCIWI